MVIDPAWDYDFINSELEKYGLHLQFIFLTHGHADHIGALQQLRTLKNVPVYIGAGDATLISNSRNNLSLFMGRVIECTSADYIAHDGDTIKLGSLSFKVLETPGHTPGGLSLYGEGVVSQVIRCSCIPLAAPIYTAAPWINSLKYQRKTHDLAR